MRRYELSDRQWARIAPLFSRRPRARGPRPAADRPPADRQRHPLDLAHRRTLARPPRALRALADRLRPLQPLAPRRHLGPHRHLAAGRTGRPGHDRPRPLVHRRLGHPGQPGGRRGAQKGRGARRLGGRKAAQMQEPPDHALGRSRGGFGTKVHLVCDSHGFILAIHVTAGQAHESKAFEPTMARRLLHERPLAGPPGGGQGLQLPGDPALVPAAADRGGDPDAEGPAARERFDRARYRRRNIVERVVGWYKEYRALGARHEKLAVNYVALWLGRHDRQSL